MKIRNRFFRALASLAGGLILSGVYHVVALLISWHWIQSWGEAMLFIGVLLAPRGFEGQAAAIPLSVLAMAVIFGIGCWFVFSPKREKRESWWPQNQIDKDR